MEPTLEHSDQVVARVVAWHNRHPLATRISAEQVHSVGVVSLPYAVQGARVAPAVPAEPPAEPAAEPTPTPEPPDAGDAMVEIDTGLVPVATADAVAVPLPDRAPVASILDRALAAPETSAAAHAGRPQNSVDPTPAAPVERPDWATRQVLELPLRNGRRTWRAAWRQWRGQGAFRALFNDDFIAPLRPRVVARWVAVHGNSQRPLTEELPWRLIDADPERYIDEVDAPALPLHVLTAAIGVGDARRRLLLAPGPMGAVLGSRHWSRMRLGAATGVLGSLALTLFMGGMSLREGAALSAPAPAPVSAAASAPASAPTAAAAVAVRVEVPVEVGAERAAQEPVRATPAPANVDPRRGHFDRPTLVATLPAAQRQTLRTAGRALRADPAAPAPARVWALVSAPLADKRQSERIAAQLQAVALLQAVPMRAESMRAGAAWRAVFWPFASAALAQQARLALADKGLHTELLAF